MTSTKPLFIRVLRKLFVQCRLARSATIPPDAVKRHHDSGAEAPRHALKVADFDGLLLAVKPIGSRLWHFKYRTRGKQKLLSFGVYPDVTLAVVRIARDAASALLAAGLDLGGVKQDRKREDRDWPSTAPGAYSL